MKPILYEANETNFTSRGIGTLSDAFACKVTENRNGSYELEMSYPISGLHFSDLKNGSLIMAVTADGKSAQPFRVYKVSKPLNGKCTIYAEHISYQLNHVPVAPFTATGCANALNGLIVNSASDCPFSVWTDISNAETRFSSSVPYSFRKLLGGVDGSILDCFGGEYEFDRYTVKLHAHRGADNGVTIRYGKNLTALTQEESIENVITGIMPYYADQDGNYVALSEKIIECANASLYPYKRTEVMDFSTEFDHVPSEDELRSKAQSYVNANVTGVPEVSLKVSFIALWQTDEYKNIAHLERVNLCDTVTVIFDKLGVSAKAKVVKTVYDVLHERYDSIEIGTVKSTLSSTVASLASNQNRIEEETRSNLESALIAQKDLMSGGLGGNVIISYNGEGKPSEVTFCDTDDITTAVNCIRINSAGIGFSQSGYNGPYNSAWTIEGSFAAENIKSGYIASERIEAGSIAVRQLTEDLQNLARSVTVNTDGIHILKLGEENAVEAVMEADGLHLYYGTSDSRVEKNYFTTLESGIYNLHCLTYIYFGIHRGEKFKAKKMSDGTEAYSTSYFAGGTE